MEQPAKPYIIKVDLSSVLNSSNSVFALFIHPKEMTMIFQLKNWIQFLFNLESTISVLHENSIIHDFESIEVLTLLPGPASVKFGGTELKKENFLKRLRDHEFSSLAPATKKRLLESAKSLGATFEDFTTLPKEAPKLINQIVEQKENSVTEIGEPQEINGDNAVQLNCSKVVSDSSDDESVGDRQKKPYTRKRVKPFSLGVFLNDLRKNTVKSSSNDSLNHCEVKSPSQPWEENSVKQKRKRVRRHKSKKPVCEPFHEPVWDMPLPELTPRPSIAQHIRFEEDSIMVEIPTTDHAVVPKSTVLEICGQEPSEFAAIEKEPTCSTPNGLELLFALKNTFGSPPVFARETPVTPNASCCS